MNPPCRLPATRFVIFAIALSISTSSAISTSENNIFTKSSLVSAFIPSMPDKALITLLLRSLKPETSIFPLLISSIWVCTSSSVLVNSGFLNALTILDTVCLTDSKLSAVLALGSIILL